MKLSEIRQKYPEYDNRTDKELADALYNKNDYSDAESEYYLPKEEFYKRIGYEQSRGPYKLGQPMSFGESADIGFKTGFGSTVSGVQQLYGQAIKDVELLDKLKLENITREDKYKRALEDNMFAAMLGNIGGATASTLPVGMIPGIGPGAIAARLGKPIGMLGKIMTGGLAGGISGGLQGGAAGALQYTPEGRSREEQALSGALWGGGLGSGIGGTIGAVQGLRPSNMFRGQLSPEELARNLETTKGTETGLGEVIGSPFLKHQQENVLTHLPLSGTEASYKRTANLLTDKGDKLLKEIAGGEVPSYENIGVEIRDGLKKAISDTQATKRKMYGDLNKEADELDLKVGRENLSSSALDELTNIGITPELAREFSSETLDDLKFYANPKNTESLKVTNIFRGKLGEKSNKAYEQGDTYVSGIYQRLKDSLDLDIKKAMDLEGTGKIKQMYDQSQEFYKKNIAPLEEKEIVKFARKGGDPDTIISSFVKTGRGQDRSILLNKLVDTLRKTPQGDQSIRDLTYGLFSKSIDQNGKVNPNTFKSIFQSLGENQKKSLFKGHEELEKQLKNYSELVSKNQKALNIMQNPPTGASLKSAFPIIGAASGAMLGSNVAGPLGALGGALAGSGLGVRPINYLLTSPKIRESLINKMLKPNKEKDFEKMLSSALSKNIPRALGAASTERKPLEILIEKKYEKEKE